MHRGIRTALALTLISALFLNTAATPARTNARVNPGGVFPTKVVSFTPSLGYTPSQVRTRLSQSEVDVVARMQSNIKQLVSYYPPHDDHTVWKIEPSAQSSPTLNLAIKVARQAQVIFSIPHSDAMIPILFIIGRTQSFIKQQIESIGCKPSAAIVNGVYLMGATVCNRNVVVINLTGYFFLRSVTQPITTYMESRHEPAISATSYLVVDRNISSLAHEWVHVARNRLAKGFIPDNEPGWFREGLAEVVSGMARVATLGSKYPYLHFHVIRLRKFFDWSTRCPLPLRRYRTNGRIPTGCEYLKGGVAVELLVAKYGGLQKIYDLFERVTVSGDFAEAFRTTYGLSLSAFESRADLYASHITRAASIPLP